MIGTELSRNFEEDIWRGRDISRRARNFEYHFGAPAAAVIGTEPSRNFEYHFWPRGVVVMGTELSRNFE